MIIEIADYVIVWLVPLAWLITLAVIIVMSEIGLTKPIFYLKDNIFFFIVVVFRVIMYSISKISGKLLIVLFFIFLVSYIQENYFSFTLKNTGGTLSKIIGNMFIGTPIEIFKDIVELIFLGEITFYSFEEKSFEYIILAIYTITFTTIFYTQIESYTNSRSIKDIKEKINENKEQPQ